MLNLVEINAYFFDLEQRISAGAERVFDGVLSGKNNALIFLAVLFSCGRRFKILKNEERKKQERAFRS